MCIFHKFSGAIFDFIEIANESIRSSSLSSIITIGTESLKTFPKKSLGVSLTSKLQRSSSGSWGLISVNIYRLSLFSCWSIFLLRVTGPS